MLYPSESLVRFVAHEATGRDFSPAFDASCIADAALAERVRAAHAVLEGSADGMRK